MISCPQRCAGVMPLATSAAQDAPAVAVGLVVPPLVGYAVPPGWVPVAPLAVVPPALPPVDAAPVEPVEPVGVVEPAVQAGRESQARGIPGVGEGPHEWRGYPRPKRRDSPIATW